MAPGNMCTLTISTLLLHLQWTSSSMVSSSLAHPRSRQRKSCSRSIYILNSKEEDGSRLVVEAELLSVSWTCIRTTGHTLSTSSPLLARRLSLMLIGHGCHTATTDTWVELISSTNMSMSTDSLTGLDQYNRQCSASSSEQRPIRPGCGRGEQLGRRSNNLTFWRNYINNSLIRSPTAAWRFPTSILSHTYTSETIKTSLTNWRESN